MSGRQSLVWLHTILRMEDIIVTHVAINSCDRCNIVKSEAHLYVKKIVTSTILIWVPHKSVAVGKEKRKLYSCTCLYYV